MNDHGKEEYESLMKQVEDGRYDGDGPADVATVSGNDEDGADL